MKSISQQIKEKEQKTLNELVAFAGGPSALAEFLGVSRQVVSYWQKRGRVSGASVAKIERATGGRFKAVDLRPKASDWRAE